MKPINWPHMLLWSLLLFIVSVATSCELTAPVPSGAHFNINGELRYRAHQQLKGGRE